MTVNANLDLVAGPYISDGTATTYTYSFPTETEDDFKVVVRDPENKIPVAVNLSNITVGPSGGQVRLTAPEGYEVVIESAYIGEQILDVQDTGRFKPSVIEVVLDRLARLHQQVDSLFWWVDFSSGRDYPPDLTVDNVDLNTLTVGGVDYNAVLAALLAQASEYAAGAEEQADRAEDEADRAESEAGRSEQEANRAEAEADRAEEEADRAESEADRAEFLVTDNVIRSLIADIPGADEMLNMVSLSTAEYEALAEIQPQTAYFITDGASDEIAAAIAVNCQTETGLITFYENDGGGNLGMRYNATPGGSNNLVEDGYAFSIRFENDDDGGGADGDVDFRTSDSTPGVAGDTINWFTRLKIRSDDGKISAPYGFVGDLEGDVTGNVTGDLDGTASQADRLTNNRTINQTVFNGTEDIVLQAGGHRVLLWSGTAKNLGFQYLEDEGFYLLQITKTDTGEGDYVEYNAFVYMTGQLTGYAPSGYTTADRTSRQWKVASDDMWQSSVSNDTTVPKLVIDCTTGNIQVNNPTYGTDDFNITALWSMN